MIVQRPFGRRGHASSVTLFGGAALARATREDADRTLEVLGHGVNHIDTAARYGDWELGIANITTLRRRGRPSPGPVTAT